MLNKIKVFARLSIRRKKLLLFTFLVSVYSAFIFTFFKKYALFGSTKEKKVSKSSNDHGIVKDISFSILAVSKYSFWPNVCRHQAYQAQILCGIYKIPFQIFVGFKKDSNNQITGHAWSIAHNQMITGFCNPDEYIIQSIFKG